MGSIAAAAETWIAIEGVAKTYDGLRVVDGVTFGVSRGELLVLLGPSGAGKSTLLYILAGFLEPSAGSVTIGGRSMKAIPAWDRDIGMVFQSYALFPHLTVRDNVAFGMRMRGVSRRSRIERAMEYLRLFGLERHAAKRPAQLSGGEQQRVALARALAYEPSVVLFDEPLGALDRKLRLELRDEIRRVQKELRITGIYVTHDQEEAFVLGDRVGIMRAGKLEQLASPEEIYRAPASQFVSTFLGAMNFLAGEVTGKTAAGTRVRLSELGTEIVVPGPRRPNGTSLILVGVRPERIQLDEAGAPDPGRTTVSGTVTAVTFRGELVDYRVRLSGGQDLLVTSLQERMLHPVGRKVRASWLPEDEVMLPSSS